MRNFVYITLILIITLVLIAPNYPQEYHRIIGSFSETELGPYISDTTAHYSCTTGDGLYCYRSVVVYLKLVYDPAPTGGSKVLQLQYKPTFGDDSLAWFDGDQALLDVNDTLTYVCDTMSIVTSDSIRFVFVRTGDSDSLASWLLTYKLSNVH